MGDSLCLPSTILSKKNEIDKYCYGPQMIADNSLETQHQIFLVTLHGYHLQIYFDNN